MRAVSYQEQSIRQRRGASWEPNGFARYQYQQALTREMPVVGLDGDPFFPEERFRPATFCQDTLDCTCGRDS